MARTLEDIRSDASEHLDRKCDICVLLDTVDAAHAAILRAYTYIRETDENWIEFYEREENALGDAISAGRTLGQKKVMLQ
jgi:hypothetical protein